MDLGAPRQIPPRVAGPDQLRLSEILRTTSFRLAATFSLVFAAATLLLFGFMYLETSVYETARVDHLLVAQSQSAADKPIAELLRAVDIGLANDLHRRSLAALFDVDGRLIAGNLPVMPPGLPVDAAAHGAMLDHPGTSEAEPVRAVARKLRGGQILVIGRYMDQLALVRNIVLRTLAVGAVPAVILSLLVGTFLSLRTVRRVRRVHQTAERIMAGDLHERLPTRGTRDDFDRLAGTVNRMLDEIQRLLNEIKGVGDDIAHDLRTPLTRVRVRLERTRAAAASPEDLHRTIDTAIAGLDHVLAIINALLRIAEIEGGRRRAGFGRVDLAAMLAEVADLYGPIAEEKTIDLRVHAPAPAVIIGDHDLLIEAVANLVSNAIKFTPEAGRIDLVLAARADGSLALRVSDSGPGIAEEERAAVLTRFYRSDKSRHVEGTGLGLSLVAAIARLHEIDLVIGGTRGCTVELICPRRAAALSDKVRQ
jgi:signal transduction histidine kinase